MQAKLNSSELASGLLPFQYMTYRVVLGELQGSLCVLLLVLHCNRALLADHSRSSFAFLPNHCGFLLVAFVFVVSLHVVFTHSMTRRYIYKSHAAIFHTGSTFQSLPGELPTLNWWNNEQQMASKGETSSRGTNLRLPFDVNVMLNRSHNTTHNLKFGGWGKWCKDARLWICVVYSQARSSGWYL